MTRKHKRMLVILACGLGLGSSAALTLTAFSDNLVYFVSPTDLAREPHTGRQLRLGGLVEQGTVERTSATGSAGVRFKVTDGSADVPVVYKGILPDLFREGQGVIVMGSAHPDGVFRASEVLAKHDETYMPKEVADALKKSGRWNPGAGPAPPASTWNEPVKQAAGQPPG